MRSQELIKPYFEYLGAATSGKHLLAKQVPDESQFCELQFHQGRASARTD